MYTYNVTIKVANAILNKWLAWMQATHIPSVLATGCFTSHKFYKLLQMEDAEGSTFVVQYTCSKIEDYDNYINNFANNLKAESFKLWGDNFIAFRTLMEAI
jgi:hypothetical protein